MNKRTLLVTTIILFLCCALTAVSVLGVFLPSSRSASYIRQSAADRNVTGGGTGFGK